MSDDIKFPSREVHLRFCRRQGIFRRVKRVKVRIGIPKPSRKSASFRRVLEYGALSARSSSHLRLSRGNMNVGLDPFSSIVSSVEVNKRANPLGGPGDSDTRASPRPR